MQWPVFSFFYCLVHIQLSLAGENRTQTKLRMTNHHLSLMTSMLASVREFPNEIHKCTATFISTKYLVTTARCLYCLDDCKYFVRTSSHYLLDKPGDSNGNIYDVQRTILHPNYDRYPQKNDIALIELETEVAMPTFPLLPENLDVDREYKGQIYSWEFSEDKKDYFLRTYPVTTISNAMCSLVFDQYIDCQHVCAKRNMSFSFGSSDQGTPLTINHEGKMYMFGYFGREGIRWPMKTEIFHLITPFIVWIKSYVKNPLIFGPTPAPLPGPKPAPSPGTIPAPSPGPRPVPSPGPWSAPMPGSVAPSSPGLLPSSSPGKGLAQIPGARPPSSQRPGLISNPTQALTTPSGSTKASFKMPNNKNQYTHPPQGQGYNKPITLFTVDENDNQPKIYQNQDYYQTLNGYNENSNQQNEDYQEYGNGNNQEYPNQVYQQNQDYYQNWNGNNGKPSKVSPQNQEPYQNWNGNMGYPNKVYPQGYGKGYNQGKPNRPYPSWNKNQNLNEEEESARPKEYLLRDFLGLRNKNKEKDVSGLPAPLATLFSNS